MRDYVQDPDTDEEHQIVESYVAVELENATGERLVAKRFVKGATDRKLVQVTRGPELSQGGRFEREDYFVLDPGAATREAGFHHMLARFMDWELPLVKRYNGDDRPLYVETVFPLFFVEQKIGWTTIPAAIPTQFQIRDVQRRSVEFLLGFDTHEVERRRHDIDLQIGDLRQEWSRTVENLENLADAAGMRILNLPARPTTLEDEVRGAFLQVLVDGQWSDLEVHLQELKDFHIALEETAIPEVEEFAEGAREAADQVTREITEINAVRSQIFKDRQVELVQLASTRRRIDHLEEDLQKNKDAKKLQSLGSVLGRDLQPHHCPTCDQLLADALLPQGTIDAVMTLDENIGYIDAQKKAFERLRDRSDLAVRELDAQLLSTGEQLRQKSTSLRALRTDLVAPSHAASAAFIEQKLRIEHRIDQLRGTVERFGQQLSRLAEKTEKWALLLTEKAALPADRLSDGDKDKLQKLQDSIRLQLQHYQFITFNPQALTVSPDTYRPEKEGFEIGFELSASDSVRLKWAYQVGLLDVAMNTKTNHPSLLVMDEPRQQEAAEVSVAGLFAEAARVASLGSQVLIATSERLASVEDFLKGLPSHQLIKFEGRLIKRIHGAV